MNLDFHSEIQGRWKVAIAASIVLALFVCTRLGFYAFGFALPVIWGALAAAIVLFTVLSFAAKEEKKKRSLIAVVIALASLAYLGLASWLRFDAFAL